MNIVYFYLQMVGKTMILDYSNLSWKMLFADTGRETVVETFHDKIYTD
jgi:ABC-type Fe2+-enterobactin transport system substrate-binding protein